MRAAPFLRAAPSCCRCSRGSRRSRAWSNDSRSREGAERRWWSRRQSSYLHCPSPAPGSPVHSGPPVPHAATLATSDDAGRVSARVLLLKDVDERGWPFATLASSPKGHALAVAPGTIDPDWSLYTVVPSRIEFWHADGDRSHRRREYRPRPRGFSRTRLWP
ncbi:pyridoxamine 5'-phosphate oxidase family protein [Microbacteriaceae bacterium VKM Ac-2855]|nr:pyridoxamine 5'-phosphate oxidase family protein [Microbacteriaceae bacterium VKM Ac-2855]